MGSKTHSRGGSLNGKEEGEAEGKKPTSAEAKNGAEVTSQSGMNGVEHHKKADSTAAADISTEETY